MEQWKYECHFVKFHFEVVLSYLTWNYCVFDRHFHTLDLVLFSHINDFVLYIFDSKFLVRMKKILFGSYQQTLEYVILGACWWSSG